MALGIWRLRASGFRDAVLGFKASGFKLRSIGLGILGH